jgi:hypothetical protein
MVVTSFPTTLYRFKYLFGTYLSGSNSFQHIVCDFHFLPIRSLNPNSLPQGPLGFS